MTTLSLRQFGITLDAFARILGLDACLFMGIQSPQPYKECQVFDCARRSEVIQAVLDAQRLIQSKTNGPLCDTLKTIKSKAPYFSIPPDWALETWRTEPVVMEVVVPEDPAAPPCTTVVELVGELVLQECEYIVGAALSQDGCACPRLPAEFCRAEYEVESVDPDTGAQTITVTLALLAYNLQDGPGPVNGTNLDWLPDEAEVIFTIAIPEKEARVFWQPQRGCCPVDSASCTAQGCCHLQECCACIRRSAADNVDVLDYQRCCVLRTCCNPFPHHFEIDVVEKGNWEAGWEQAVVSLANNLLPQDWCVCNPMANLRYEKDTGHIGGDYARPDAMFYGNPFGYFTPGAKSAWEIVSKPVKKPVLVTL